MKIGFTGKAIEVQVSSLLRVDIFNKDKGIYDRYEMNFPKTNVTNIIFGKMMFNFWGDIVSKNMDTGDTCKLDMTAATAYFMREKNRGKLSGVVYEKGTDKPKFKLHGSWLKDILVSRFDDEAKEFVKPTCIYSVPQVSEEEDDIWSETYRMGDVGLNVNYLDEELKKNLPPTDSRWRPDQAAMERGEFDFSTQEKKRLEQEQRERRKLTENEKPPVYFTKEVINEKEKIFFYKFGGDRDYWEDKKNNDWEHLPRFFD